MRIALLLIATLFIAQPAEATFPIFAPRTIFVVPSAGFNPHLNRGFDPRFDPRFNRGFDPRFDRGFGPRFDGRGRGLDPRFNQQLPRRR